MSSQDNGGVNNGGIAGKPEGKPKKTFREKIRNAVDNTWLWLTTSRAGKVVMGLGTVTAAGIGAKLGFDKGFQKGAASVKPEIVYLPPTEDDEETQEPEDEPVEETAE